MGGCTSACFLCDSEYKHATMQGRALPEAVYNSKRFGF